MEARFNTWWQQIKIHLVRVVLIAFLTVVIALIILSILGYIFNWGWTGLGSYISPPHPKDSDFQRGKTLWDWLQLLIIPAVLAVAGYVINLTISRGEQEATKQRAKTEREIAQDNQREAALQEYIDKMSELLLHEKLRESQPENEVRTIARVRTLTVLPRLDGKRKGSVIQFLIDSELINRGNTIIDLDGANLGGANLRQAHLGCISLEKHIDDNVIYEDKGANFSGANLRNTFLSDINLRNTNLEEVDLSGAYIDIPDDIYIMQLAKAKSLKGATMPDGSIHP